MVNTLPTLPENAELVLPIPPHSAHGSTNFRKFRKSVLVAGLVLFLIFAILYHFDISSLRNTHLLEVEETRRQGVKKACVERCKALNVRKKWQSLESARIVCLDSC